MAKQFLHSTTAPVVQTEKGKIRGFQLDDIYTFYGIKYAEAERFQAPKSIQPWDGIKDALYYGPICPLMNTIVPGDDFMVPHRFWPQDEDCHYLNIWTQSLDEDAKKPVMVWLHGGTFNAGSSIELVAYDGDAMAKHHDVVFVTLNHRLNILGYLDMSSYGSKYENSVNAGIADLVEALRWIRDNIAAFGGDPDNVTIFGQSGGGRKTTTLLQTPAAAGLFHKAIIQSGTLLWNPVSSEHHGRLIKLMLGELGLSDAEYEKLEVVPYPVLVRAYSRARIRLEEEGITTDWTPVKNGWFLGAPPFNEFSDHACKIPLMLGSVIGERGDAPPMPGKDDYPAKKRRELLVEMYGEHTDRLIELFRTSYPGKNELVLLDFDSSYRNNLLNYTERKIKESAAGVPTYVYLFAPEFNYRGGKPAWHCSDIAFAFRTAERIPAYHTEATERLQREISGAWANFARTGDPNHSDLPEKWPEYSLDERGVMVFDEKSEVKRNHEGELIELHNKIMLARGRRRGNRHNLVPEDEKWTY